MDSLSSVATSVIADGVETIPTAFVFTYHNHRGENAVRRVLIKRVYWGRTFYYPEDQWLLEGYDYDRKEDRIYALAMIVPGDVANELVDYAAAVLAGNNPFLHEPFASVGTLMRRLTTQLHDRAAKLDEALITNSEMRRRNERLEEANRLLSAATHNQDGMQARIDDLTARNAELTAQLAGRNDPYIPAEAVGELADEVPKLPISATTYEVAELAIDVALENYDPRGKSVFNMLQDVARVVGRHVAVALTIDRVKREHDLDLVERLPLLNEVVALAESNNGGNAMGTTGLLTRFRDGTNG